MRLIGIGLLAFLLAGLALLLARSEMVGQTWRAVRTLTDGPQLRFETPMAAEARAGADQAIIQRAGPAAPLILSGLPAYQGAVFHMPIDARPTSGYLQIDATSQVLDGVEGVLRISIDNTRRAEVLLRPGEAARAVRIELTSADIARAQLVVSFSLQGTVANTVCTADHAVSAVVEIETTSALYLSLDAPLESPRDLVASWGDQMRLVWDGEDASLLQAVAATRAGVQTFFVPEIGLTDVEAADALDQIFANRSPVTQPEFAWSPALENEGGLYGLRRFQRSHTWRLRYDLTTGRNANLPQALELLMFLPAHPMGADWQITITHDGRLLEHITGTARQTRLSGQIAIPEAPGNIHTIEITLTSAFQPDGECNDGPEILAEILPNTTIAPSTHLATSAVRQLSHALAEFGQVGVLVSEALSAAEANVAVGLLDDLLPIEIVALDEASTGAVHVIPRGTDLAEYSGEGLWLVYRGDDGALTASRLSAHSVRETASVSLLVALPEAAT